MIGSDLLSESNKLCKHSEPRCGEEARKKQQYQEILKIFKTKDIDKYYITTKNIETYAPVENAMIKKSLVSTANDISTIVR